MPRKPPASWVGRTALTVRHLAELAFFDLAAAASCVAPPGLRLRLGVALGTLYWLVDIRHRRQARENLRLAYGDQMSAREIRRLVRRSMQHFGRVAVETLAFPRHVKGLDDGRIHVEGLDLLKAAHARGRGVLGFSGHFGHWELLALTLGRHGLPSAVVARPLDNPYLERRLLALRSGLERRVLGKRQAIRGALRVLRAGGFVALLIDQRPRQAGLLIPFFGHPAHTRETLALLALRTGAPIVPGYCVLEGDGTWRVVIEREVPVVPTGNREADLRRIMAECTAMLEGWIRQYPEQWLWTHGRWRAPRDLPGGSPAAIRETRAPVG